MSGMSSDPNAHQAPMPAVPERAMRVSEDNTRMSEDTDAKRAWRNSTATVRTPAHPAQPSIVERPSIENPYHTSPSHQQIAQWQPHDPATNPESLQEPPRSSGSRPGPYARSTSNDYTVFGGVDTPTPINSSQGPNPNNAAVPYPGSQNYFGAGLYKRTGVRDNTDNASLKTGKYTPLATSHTPRKSTASNRPHWPDGYDANYDYDNEVTPNKRPMRKKSALYIVRGGSGDGGGGNDPPEEIMRLPFSSWMESDLKNHFVAVLGEFVGTTLFLFFAFAGTLVANMGAQQTSKSTTTNATVGFSPIVLMYIAISFGFSLMVNVWVFFRVSGGLFNPAVTLGMVMTKTIGYVRGFLLVAAQLVGAIFAAFLSQVLFPSQFNVRTTLAESTSTVRGLFIEAILTAELVFTVFMLAKEEHKATYMAPVGIGLALFVAELVGVFFTGGSLNPARSFGPCVTTGKFDSEHWIYWVGPAIGSVGAFAFYRFIKILEYEVANPGQDHNSEDEELASLRSKEHRRGEV